MDVTLFQDPAFWLLALFLVPLLLRVPIALSLGLAALVVVWRWDMGFEMLSYNFYAGIAKFPLLAIPFFILAGYIMERADIASRIVALMEALVGSMTGGLAVATVAVTAGLAIVIPPSIAFIVYGGVADVSVPALFAAGFLPGILVALCIMAAVLCISRKKGYRGTAERGPGKLGRAFRNAFWGVMTPVVILSGIYGGVFTPTEAAAVAVFYGLFVGVFIYRTINSVAMLFEIFAASMRATAVVMIVVTCAGLFSWVASTVGLVEKGSAVLLSLSDNQWIVLLMINAILLLAGMLLDAISIYYVFLPFMLPLMAHFGWDPVWFGIMMTVNLAVGQVTPPVAVNLYVGANISGLTMEQISKPALPLIGASLLALVIIILFPQLSTWLPRALGLM